MSSDDEDITLSFKACNQGDDVGAAVVKSLKGCKKRVQNRTMTGSKKHNKKVNRDQLGFDYRPEGREASNQETSDMSSADIFYAQMNGEKLLSERKRPHHRGSDVSDEAIEVMEVSEDSTDEDDEADFPDCGSFAVLSLSRYMDLQSLSEQDDEWMPPVSPNTSTSRSSRPSLVSDSSFQNQGHNSDARCSTVVSIERLQEYVWQSLPSEIQEQMSKQTWREIFERAPLAELQGSGESSTRTPVNMVVTRANTHTHFEEKEWGDHGRQLAIDSDTASIVSDMSTESVELEKATISKVAWTPATKETGHSQWMTISPESSSSTHASISQACSTAAGNNSGVRRSGDRSVHFGRVQVRHYERVLDINPAVSSGAAIAIGWGFRRGGRMSVDTWEMQRKRPIRNSTELVMTRRVRETLLKDWGYSQKEIAAATRNIQRTKSARKVTIQNLLNNKVIGEAVGRTARHVKGLLKLR